MANDASSMIAERYAHALFALSGEQGVRDAVERDLLDLQALLAESSELAGFVSNPLISRTQKAEAVDALLAKGKASELARKFVKRLALNARLGVLSAAAAVFHRLSAEARGEAEVEITSAAPMAAADIKALEAALGKTLARKVRAVEKQDPKLLAGFVINVDGKRLDYSLAGKLSRLSQALKHAA